MLSLKELISKIFELIGAFEKTITILKNNGSNNKVDSGKC
jgi:hypothetical protein